MPSAETVYLFRHALVQSAAYELQPVSARARLHAFAFDVIEDLCGGAPVVETPHWLARSKPHPTDAFALELASHADLAAASLQSEHYARKAALYHFRCAYIDERDERLLDAMKHFEKLAEHPGADDYLHAQGHMGAGQGQYKLGNLDVALAHYDAAETYLNASTNPPGAQMLKSCRTVVASHSHNGPEIAESHLEAANFWAELGDKRRELSSLINYAIWHCEEGDHEVAREALIRSIDMAREVGHLRAEEAALGTLGLLDQADGRLDEAEASINHAIEITRKMNNEVSELEWIIGLAELARHRGRLAESESGYLQAMEIADKVGIKLKREYAEAHLAPVLVEAGRIDDARRYWQSGRSGIAARNDSYTLNGADWNMQKALKQAGLPPLNADGSFPV